ncbi:kinetochore protein NDC80 homolog [Phragmites australis]|uniref:kinetochore protein NDC80 homolog n=1 Tax=Phragmites australis TaxID=29695 RepID=UPI002D793714|nr:kinetochore protein NDC80 homolog [Phragmites australis]
MRRGGGGGRRLPKSSLAPSAAAEGTPSLEPSVIRPRNLDLAFSRRDSDVASLCSSRPPSSIGVGTTASAPNFSDRATQAAALRVVNAFLDPAVTLRPPLPAARDILAALRHLLERLHFPVSEKEAGFEDDLLYVLRMLGCPYKLTRSALKAPGTPHSWPPLLSVLHWLTLLASVSDDVASSPSASAFNDLMLYTTQGYSYFISGDDDAVASLDDEYVSKAREHAEAAVEAFRALEKEAQELEAKAIKLTSGPSRREALEAEKETFTADIHKFEAVVKTWSAKMDEKGDALLDLEKELEAKVMDGRRIAAENQDLLKKVEAQAVNVRDADRMHREMQVVERDIAKAESGKAALEDKGWELEAALVTKLEELEGLAEQCNQALKRLKPDIDFQYMLNAKGSSPAEILGLSYKTVLKPALKAHAEENKRVSVSKLEESVDLQKQLQEIVKILEDKRNNISSLQAKTDEMVARLNSLDREIKNDDSRCTADARQMNDEYERKDHLLSTAEKEADDILKNSEKRLQDALRKADEETQMCANELLQLVDSIMEYKEFMETVISQRKKDLSEAADYIASLPSKMSSTCKTSYT